MTRPQLLGAGWQVERPRVAAAPEDFYAFFRRVCPRLEEPRHLQPMIDVAERIERGEPVRVVVATPPRHAKTTSWLRVLVWLLSRHPEWPLAYITYAAELAQSKSYEARQVAHDAGVKVSKDRANLGEWMTEHGGRFVATGVGGAMTGRGFRAVVTDDPFKGREQADSPLIRERTWEWFNSVAFTRQEPDGTAFVVNATRWHPDDLSGRLVKQGWEYINLPAIDDAERALWSAKYPVERLREIEEQIGPYEFGALYQGEPRAKGATVFEEPTYYDDLPVGVGFKTSIGADFAYTIRTWSDFSVAIALRRYTNGDIYVVDVVRLRCEMPAFKARLHDLCKLHGAKPHAFVSGTERGGLSFFAEHPNKVDLDMLPAVADKFARAQPAAAAWNAGRILLPKTRAALASLGGEFARAAAKDGEAKPEWLQPFMDEVLSFTGVKDPHDDCTDALAGGFEPFRTERLADRPVALVSRQRTTRYGGQRGF